MGSTPMKPLSFATALCGFLVTLAVPTCASATTLGLGAANSYGNYLGQAISPYNGKLNGSTIASGIICLDITIDSRYNTQWTVTTATPTAVAEQRAAFLALQLFNATAATRGALTMAIWYINGYLGDSGPRSRRRERRSHHVFCERCAECDAEPCTVHQRRHLLAHQHNQSTLHGTPAGLRSPGAGYLPPARSGYGHPLSFSHAPIGRADKNPAVRRFCRGHEASHGMS